MGYKTIATVLHDAESYEETLQFAIAAARRWDAHLHVICAGINITDPGFYYAGASPGIIAENLKQAKADAGHLLTLADTDLGAQDIRWDTEGVILTTGAMNSYLIDHMRYFDLAVLPSPYALGRGRTDITIFEACLFGARMPVLVAPAGAALRQDPLRFMLAWDDGPEALAAARALPPLFEAGNLTEICLIDPPSDGPERSDPGGRLAQMLARWGGNVEISVLAKLQRDIAEQLLQHATETQADMLVMGAYGHSRLREAVIGGVTRSVLRHAKLPILMAH